MIGHHTHLQENLRFSFLASFGHKERAVISLMCTCLSPVKVFAVRICNAVLWNDLKRTKKNYNVMSWPSLGLSKRWLFPRGKGVLQF